MSKTAIQWAQEIAAHLIGEWRAEPGVWRDQAGSEDAVMVGPSGEHVRIIANNRGWCQPGKLRIDTFYANDLHKHLRYNAKKYEINVSETKTPERIAAEIERRLLPGYREQLAEVQEVKRRSDEINARQATVAAELAALLGARANSHREHAARFGSFGNGGDFEVNSTDVEVKFRLPHSAALAVVKAISEVVEFSK